MDELPDGRRVATEGATSGAAGTAREEEEGGPPREGEPADGQHGESTPGVFAEFTATIPDPVLVVDGGLSVVTGNPQFGEQFGRDPAALRGEPVSAVFPALTRDRVVGNCDAGPGEYVTTPLAGGEPADDRTWVDLAFDRNKWNGQTYFVGIARDVTARRRRDQEFEQYQRILETIEDGIYVLDDSFVIQAVNSAVESMTGYDRSELVGEPATKLADESAIDEAARLSEQLIAGQRDNATLTTELRTGSGDRLPIETRFSTFRGHEGKYRQVGVVRDVSERRQFERTLATLHESTRELLEAQTTDEVSTLVVESVVDALDIEGAALYRFDQAANSLSPDAVSGPLEGVGDATAVGAGDNPLWEAFVDDERRTVVRGDDRPADVEGPATAESSALGICFPLGSYGVFYVSLGADQQRQDVVGVMEVIAANTEAALARVDREQALRDQDEELLARNRRLRQLEEVNAIIRRIDRALVDADTRAEVEQAVCDGLEGSELVSFAWVGVSDGLELDPRAWAGEAPGYLDAVSLETASSDGPPAVKATEQQGMTVVPSVAADLREEAWRTEALSRDLRSALSVPLRYEEFTYGVLTVYGAEQSVFDETLQSVFAELGETIARAVCEVQSRRRRSGATTVELDLSVSAPTAPLQQLGDKLGAPVDCAGVVPDEDGITRLFVRAGADPSTVQDCWGDLTCVQSVTTVTDWSGAGDERDGEKLLYEVLVSGETVPGTLLNRGVRVRSLDAAGADSRLNVVVRLPPGLDARGLVEYLDTLYESAELTARRENDIEDRSDRGTRATVQDRLTDRQLQVLRTAYFSGFFDWPRKTTGQDLAEKLDVSQPTVSRHLRKGTGRVFDILFETV